MFRWLATARLLPFVLSLSLVGQPARAQSAGQWSGTWAGTYDYTNANCPLDNPGTISLTLLVTNGQVSGGGVEYHKLCYDTNTCAVLGSGTLHGSITGAVSGATMTLGGNWTNTCNRNVYFTSFSGSMSNMTIIGSPSLVLRKQIVENGDFDAGDFTGWTLSGDASGTFVDDGSGSGILPYAGGLEASLSTISGSHSYLSQTLQTTPGATYLVSFWLNNIYVDPHEFFVTWNGNTLFAETNLAAASWTNIECLATASGTNSVLQFGFQDNFDFLGLDNINVVEQFPPRITNVGISQSNVMLHGTNGLSGQTYRVLMGTNLAEPRTQWTSLLTNTLSSNGDFVFVITNGFNVNSPSRFFILQLQ
jgi:hypothetical protein